MDQLDKFYVLLLTKLEFIYYFIESILLRKFPYAPQLTLASQVINGTMAVHGAFIGKTKPYWLHSLVLVVLTSFGGGIIVPAMLGKPSIVFANDLVIPMCITSWYAIHYLGFYHVLNWKPIKIIWSILLGVFRSHAVIDAMNLALSVLTPVMNSYYPIPLIGPILAATLGGCLGGFLPFDKGLQLIQKNCPWVIQSAFMSAVFYFFMIKDTEGFIGEGIRNIFGSLSEKNVILLISFINVSTLVLQIVFHPQVNLFNPFHKFLYLIFQVKGPIITSEDAVVIANKPNVGWDYDIRIKFEVFMDVFRHIVLFSLLAMYVLTYMPCNRLHAVDMHAIDSTAKIQLNGGYFNKIALNRSLGHSQWLSLLLKPVSAFIPAANNLMIESMNPLVLHLEEYRVHKDNTNNNLDMDASNNTGKDLVSLFRSGSLQKIYYRLSSYQRYETNSYNKVSHTFNVQAKHEKSNSNQYYWSSKIPFEITSKSYKSLLEHTQQHSIDLNTISLYLTKQSILYLIVPEQYSITYQRPIQTITTTSNSKVLWSGKLLKSCSKDAIALFIDDKDGGIPKVLCSNNEILPLEISTDSFYSLENYHHGKSNKVVHKQPQDGSKREL